MGPVGWGGVGWGGDRLSQTRPNPRSPDGDKKGCPVHPWIILNSDNHVAHCIDPCLPSPSEITNNREKTRPNGLVGAASCNLDQVKGDEWPRKKGG